MLHIITRKILRKEELMKNILIILKNFIYYYYTTKKFQLIYLQLNMLIIIAKL